MSANPKPNDIGTACLFCFLALRLQRRLPREDDMIGGEERRCGIESHQPFGLDSIYRFEIGNPAFPGFLEYDVSRDGQRFIVNGTVA